MQSDRMRNAVLRHNTSILIKKPLLTDNTKCSVLIKLHPTTHRLQLNAIKSALQI